ncbi:MAG TPA: phosphatase PAP2 family protein [Solirubrobacteraceae bacterium]|nr:phosphatase PAP2 family protein [Solirubrobacteraceae bacterium]
MPQPTRRATLAAIDDRIYRLFRSTLHEHEPIERVIAGLTRAQNWWAFASLAGLIADNKRRPAWARANAGLGAAWAATKLISCSVARSRPNLHDCQPARQNNDHQSFPSTHTAVSFAAAVVLPPLLPRTPLIVLATATAGGRLLLGEHYPSDVVVGAALGAAVAAPFARTVASKA